MVGTIIAVVRPYGDESVHSLLTRAIEANVYDRISWLREASGIPYAYQDLWSLSQCDRLARLLGLSEHEIRQRAYVPDGDGFAYFGHRLTRKQFEWGRRKACPHCLERFGYHSAVFDLSALQVCPLHAVRLRTTCHACDKRLRWSMPSLLHCSNCEADLRDASCDAVPTEELQGVAAIARMAGFPLVHADVARTGVDIPEGLRHLGLGELQTLAVRLGLFLKSGQRSWQGHALNDPDDAHRILDGAWAILRDWPVNFFALLHEVSAPEDEAPRYTAGVRRAFRRLYDYPIHRSGEPWTTLQSALREFTAHHWTGHALRRVNAKLPVRSRMVSETEVAKVIGVAKTRALLGSGAVYAEIVSARSGAGRTSKMFVDRDGLRILCPGGVAPLDLNATATRLGLSQKLTKRLATGGVLEPLDGPTVGTAKRWLFAVPEIDRLVDRLQARTTRQASDDRLTVGFVQLLKAHGELGLPMNDVFSAILAGPLPPVGRSSSGRGLAAFQFDEGTMRMVFRAIAAGISAFSEVSRPDVVREIGCRKDTVAWLVANGYLEEVAGFGRQRPITRVSLDRFKEQWVKAGEIAKLHRSNRMLVTRALNAADVTVTRPTSDKITLFFDRAQVDALDVGFWLARVAVTRAAKHR